MAMAPASAASAESAASASSASAAESSSSGGGAWRARRADAPARCERYSRRAGGPWTPMPPRMERHARSGMPPKASSGSLRTK
eukprot:scaffold3826_cov78-Phaeocystis_antarctica.AAC.6